MSDRDPAARCGESEKRRSALGGQRQSGGLYRRFLRGENVTPSVMERSVGHRGTAVRGACGGNV